MRSPILPPTTALCLPLVIACAAPDRGPRAPSDTGTALPEAPWGPPDAVGPWAVGARTERAGDLTLEVWYPTRSNAPPEPYPDLPLLPLPGVPRDVAPAGAEMPVVIFSHGYGGTRLQSVFLTEHLASHGFVVVGVDHPLNTAFDLDANETAVVALRRPVDVARAADHVLASEDLPVQRGVFAVVGHSFGAFTALVSGGGRLDVDAALATCATADLAGCAFVAGLDVAGLPVPAPDPRVAATAVLAPGGWYAFGDDGLAGVAPTLVVAGRRDEDLPYDEEALPTWARLPGAPLATLERAGHWGFVDGCAYVPLADCAGEPDYTEPRAIQQITKTLVTAWLGQTLRSDARYEPWLEGSAWEGTPDLTWTHPR